MGNNTVTHTWDQSISWQKAVGATLVLKIFIVCLRLWTRFWTMLELKDLKLLFNLYFDYFLGNALYIQALCCSLWGFSFGTHSDVNSVFFSFCRWLNQNRLTTQRYLPGILLMQYYKYRKTTSQLLHYNIMPLWSV